MRRPSWRYTPRGQGAAVKEEFEMSQLLRRLVPSVLLALVVGLGTTSDTHAQQWGRFLPGDCDIAFVIKGVDAVFGAVEAYADRVQPGSGVQVRGMLELSLAAALGANQWDGLAKDGALILAYDNAREMTTGRASWIVAQVTDHDAFVRSLFSDTEQKIKVERLDGGIQKIAHGERIHYAAEVDGFAVISSRQERIRTLLDGKLPRPALSDSLAQLLERHAAAVYVNAPRLLERFRPELEMFKTQMQLGMAMAAQQEGAAAAQVEEAAEAIQKFFSSLEDLHYAVIGASATPEMLDIEGAVQPRPGTALAKMFGSLEAGPVGQSLGALPDGAYAYVSIAGPSATGAANQVAAGQLGIGIGQLVSSAEARAREANIRYREVAAWLDRDEGFRALVVLHCDKPDVYVNALVEAAQELSQRDGDETAPYKSATVRRSAVELDGVKFDEVKLELDEEIVQAMSGFAEVFPGSPPVGSKQVLLAGSARGRVLLTVGSSAEVVGKLAQQYLDGTATLARQTGAAALLRALGERAVALGIVDMGTIVTWLVPAAEGGPGYVGFTLRSADASPSLRLLITADALARLIQVGAAVRGAEAEFVD